MKPPPDRPPEPPPHTDADAPDEPKRKRKGANEIRLVSSNPNPEDPSDFEAWRHLCVWRKTERGEYLMRDTTNVITILKNDPTWKGKIRLDTFVNNIEARDPPWTPECAITRADPYWTDSDTTRLHVWMIRKYDWSLRTEALETAVLAVAEAQQYSSAEAWMRTLRWDGTPRIQTWLSRYLGAEESLVNAGMGQWWLISAVARVMSPGCKADHVLVLQGPQGAGKSRALRALAGDAWHSDASFDLASKDSYLALRGKLIVELGEFVAVRRAEEDRAKAFFSTQVDHYRQPYGRRTVSVPRQCVFAGTTNNEAIFRDETGNRRYWPVTCGIIDIAALTADREQLWAEAVAMYDKGSLWYPSTDFERDLCTETQERRTVERDAWIDSIAAWLESDTRPSDEDGGITVSQVLGGAINKPTGQWARGDEMRVAAALRALGWRAQRKWHSGGVRRRYLPPTAPQSDPTP